MHLCAYNIHRKFGSQRGSKAFSNFSKLMYHHDFVIIQVQWPSTNRCLGCFKLGTGTLLQFNFVELSATKIMKYPRKYWTGFLCMNFFLLQILLLSCGWMVLLLLVSFHLLSSTKFQNREFWDLEWLTGNFLNYMFCCKVKVMSLSTTLIGENLIWANALVKIKIGYTLILHSVIQVQYFIQKN